MQDKTITKGDKSKIIIPSQSFKIELILKY